MTIYDTTPTPPVDYDQSKVPEPIKRRADYVRTKYKGGDILEATAQNAEVAGIYAGEAKQLAERTQIRQDAVEDQFDAVQRAATETADWGGEIIVASDGEATLGGRLDRDLQVVKKTAENLEGRGVNVMHPPIPMIGAKGDGVTDDRQAIQNILDSFSDGTKFVFPAPSDFYNVGSTHPEFAGHGLIIDKDNFLFEFETGSYHRAMIKATVPMTSVVYAPISKRGLDFKNMNLDANNLADYAFKGDDNYLPYLSMENCHFGKAKIACLAVATYVATLTRCLATNGQLDGFLIRGPEDTQVTSITLNSCYANTNARYGYHLIFMTYCSLNSCASDNNDIGYYLKNSYGVALNACGAEKCRKPLLAESYRGLSIAGFYGLNNGAESGQVTDYLLEFGQGENVTISGVSLQLNKGYKKILGLTSSAYGFENITILDDSIKRDEVDFVPNFTFERPIKFLRGDETNKNITVTLHVDELSNHLKEIEELKINHVYTIQLTGARQSPLTRTWGNSLNRLSGSGRIVIQGDAGNRDTVKLLGSHQKARAKDTSVTVEFKNLSIIAVESGGAGFDLLTVDNGRKVILNNVRLNADGKNARSAVRAENGSEVLLINGSIADNGTFLDGDFSKDASSRITQVP